MISPLRRLVVPGARCLRLVARGGRAARGLQGGDATTSCRAAGGRSRGANARPLRKSARSGAPGPPAFSLQRVPTAWLIYTSTRHVYQQSDQTKLQTGNLEFATVREAPRDPLSLHGPERSARNHNEERDMGKSPPMP